MSATKFTQNLDLSQFQPDDVPQWQTDYNSDMRKIDQGYGNLKTSIGGDVSTINQSIEDLQTAQTTVEGEITALQKQQTVNTAAIITMKTDITSNTQEIASLDARMEAAEANIEDLQDNGIWVVLGDDYALQTNSWIEQLQAMTGKTQQTFYKVANNGVGWSSNTSTYTDALANFIAATPGLNKNQVIAVIVVGGKNENTNGAAVNPDIATNMRTFVNKVALEFPNAKPYVAYLGWQWSVNNNLDYAGKQVQIAATKVNAVALNGVELSLHSDGLWDGVNLSESGQTSVALAVFQAMYSGMYTALYNNEGENIPVTFASSSNSNITSDNTVVNSVIATQRINGAITHVSYRSLVITFGEAVEIKANDNISITLEKLPNLVHESTLAEYSDYVPWQVQFEDNTIGTLSGTFIRTSISGVPSNNYIISFESASEKAVSKITMPYINRVLSSYEC